MRLYFLRKQEQIRSIFAAFHVFLLHIDTQLIVEDLHKTYFKVGLWKAREAHRYLQQPAWYLPHPAQGLVRPSMCPETWPNVAVTDI